MSKLTKQYDKIVKGVNLNKNVIKYCNQNNNNNQFSEKLIERYEFCYSNRTHMIEGKY